jgi:hypothetical protein
VRKRLYSGYLPFDWMSPTEGLMPLRDFEMGEYHPGSKGWVMDIRNFGQVRMMRKPPSKVDKNG